MWPIDYIAKIVANDISVKLANIIKKTGLQSPIYCYRKSQHRTQHDKNTEQFAQY